MFGFWKREKEVALNGSLSVSVGQKSWEAAGLGGGLGFCSWARLDDGGLLIRWAARVALISQQVAC